MKQRWFGIAVELGTYLVLLAVVLWVLGWCLRWVLRGLALALSLVWLSGCYHLPTDETLITYVERLNQRQVKSCIFWSGSVAPYVSIRGITMTGGIEFEECVKQR